MNHYVGEKVKRNCGRCGDEFTTVLTKYGTKQGFCRSCNKIRRQEDRLGIKIVDNIKFPKI